MKTFRLALAALAFASVLSACSSYKQVSDPADGSNDKYKHHLAGSER